MYRGSSTRVISAIVIIAVIGLAVFALVSVGRAIFGGDDNNQAPAEDNRGQETLLQTSVDNSVSLKVRGRLVADEYFRSYQIVVSPEQRRLSVYAGYLESVEKQNNYSNNTRAYEEFVYALNRADFMAGDEIEGSRNDRRGVCADGNLYEFAVIKAGRPVKTLWTTDCDGAPGSFSGNRRDVVNLFQNQLPKDGREVISRVDL